MEALLQSILQWIELHPYASLILVFTVALMESLIMLGLLIPGAVLLFGVGALIATGALPMGPILLWTIAGAICGDLISFMLGHHYHQQLRVIWPFKKYPELITRGVDFFYRHGGKGVFLARFIGPLRPIVPAIAGMMNMTVPRFLLVDIIACILWAPVYILPGVVFGASLGLAAEVAGRLVVLLVSVVGLTLLGIWLLHGLFRLLQPHASSLIDKVLDWSRRHPRIRPLAGSLLDPDHPEARGLAILSVLFFAALWLLLLTVSQVYSGQVLHGIDHYVYHGLANLRTPWADHVMVFITQLGNTGFLALLLAGSCAWLLLRRYTRAALHWFGACSAAGLLTWSLKFGAEVERPTAGLEGYSFPSAHTSMSFVVYGFLALMIARELPHRHRWLPYTITAVIAGSIAFSRLYLGAHWFSDVLAGASLGVFWVALIGIAYDRHPAPAVPLKSLLSVVALVMTVGISWQLERRFDDEMSYYAPRIELRVATLEEWKEHAWRMLPTWRIDLEGSREQPMNFQWAGTLGTLQEVLQEHGWHAEKPVELASAMNWLAPDPVIGDLPVMPQVHDGHHQELLLVAEESGMKNRVKVLRLWPSDLLVGDGGRAVWIGNVTWLYVERNVPLIAFLRTAANFDTPLERLEKTLAGSARINMLKHQRSPDNNGTDWGGRVLLAW